MESKWNCQNCGINFKAIGCYKDHFTRPLPEEILNERDVTSKVYGGQKIRWHDWDNYMAGFACRCAEAAKAKGYSVFALQFYGNNAYSILVLYINQTFQYCIDILMSMLATILPHTIETAAKYRAMFHG